MKLWSLRCSWNKACWRCSNYIFILDWIPGCNGLGEDNCKTRREIFKFWNLVRCMPEVWHIYTYCCAYIHTITFYVLPAWFYEMLCQKWRNRIVQSIKSMICIQEMHWEKLFVRYNRLAINISAVGIIQSSGFTHHEYFRMSGRCHAIRLGVIHHYWFSE